MMSNHPRSSRGPVLHVVVQTLLERVASWSDDEIALRWARLFPRLD
jgi:hypothetical protein